MGRYPARQKSFSPLTSVCAALSGTEITVFEHLDGFANSFFQQARFIGSDVTRFMGWGDAMAPELYHTLDVNSVFVIS